ncbi:MAG: hypothetical protein JWL86_1722 [Rhizobium sp.]|nr:hypothetical protein [Rhizobium sp.]
MADQLVFPAIEPTVLPVTGTPAGVGPVVPGDVMVGAVAGLDTITVTVGDKAR